LNLFSRQKRESQKGFCNEVTFIRTLRWFSKISSLKISNLRNPRNLRIIFDHEIGDNP